MSLEYRLPLNEVLNGQTQTGQLQGAGLFAGCCGAKTAPKTAILGQCRQFYVMSVL
jgi:hypothetical protein